MTDSPIKASVGSVPGLWQRSARADLVAVIVIAAVAAALYFLFPASLALLTRIVAIMLLVLSLDLVTGYAGVATLGHATVFGAGAYAAGIAAAHFGITDPLAMLAIGAVSGALAGAVSSLVILRGHGLSQLVLSIAVVQLAHELASKLSAWTGGSDGLSGDRLFAPRLRAVRSGGTAVGRPLHARRGALRPAGAAPRARSRPADSRRAQRRRVDCGDSRRRRPL